MRVYVLQCDAVCCSTLQNDTVEWESDACVYVREMCALENEFSSARERTHMPNLLQRVAACCSVLEYFREWLL